MKLKMIALFSVLALVVSACGTDETTETTETTAAAETTTTTEAVADDEMAEEDMSGDAMNIVETAAAAGDFSTLLTAVEAAGLTDTLATGGPFTVFAPTDEAFAAIDEDTLNDLLADPEALSEVLLYHVVEGEVYAADVVTLDSATTVQGSDVEIAVDGDTVTINGATVVMTDIQTSNGVIHVIDAVLLP